MNPILLEVFWLLQDKFLLLSLETPIVGPENFQENISLLRESAAQLEQGNIDSVLDEIFWMVNGINKWYNYYISSEIIAHIKCGV